MCCARARAQHMRFILMLEDTSFPDGEIALSRHQKTHGCNDEHQHLEVGSNGTKVDESDSLKWMLDFALS